MARVSIRSPRTNMPTSSYRPPSGRRNSTTYGDSYTTSTYNRQSRRSERRHSELTDTDSMDSGIRTGGSRDSFNNAASRFSTTSSTYGASTYGRDHGTSTYTSSKPPVYRSRVTSPSPIRSSSLASSSSSSTRALPPGPGPRDHAGRKITVSDARSTFRKTSRDSHTPTRLSPLKADYSQHSTASSMGYSSSSNPSTSTLASRDYAGSTGTVYHTPRLSRDKRTNSISDLTSSVDSMSIGSPRQSLRKFGSTTDINGNVDSFQSFSQDKRNGHYGSETNGLPDINDRPNSATSRSPSLDRVKKNNAANNNYNQPSTSSRQKSLSPETGGRGLVGLRNLGNTCFMSCMIQSLSHTPQMRKYMLQGLYLEELNTTTSSMKGALAKSFAKLLQQLWSKDSHTSVSPTDFKEKISKFAPRFIGYNQQDAQEFLIYLLEGLHEDLNRHKQKKKRVIDCESGVVTTPAKELAKIAWKNYRDVDDSFICDLFVGQLRSALTCTVCDYVSNTFDIFMDLSLPIRKRHGSVQLDDCFRLFTQEETLDGDERPMCAKCKKRQRCTKRFSIQKFPDVLILHLKRFNQEYRSKLSTLVDYPLKNLDLTEYAAESCPRGRYIYNLFAVSCHSGTPYGGHYYAYANTGGPGSNTWHSFNDQTVSARSASSVVCSDGYVLFYQRTTT